MRMTTKYLAATLGAAGLVIALTISAQANDPKVRIFYPSAQANIPPHMDADAEARPVQVSVTVVLPQYDEDYYRARAIRWAFGHRYLGFIKMYRGPRYPF